MPANGKEPVGKRRSTDSSSGGSASKKRPSTGGRSGIEGLLVPRVFKNTLPDTPPAPKFLPMPFLDSSRYVEYQHTTLEKAHKSEIHVDRDLGVPIELIDTSVYEGGENLDMHPTDAALLVDPPAGKQTTGEEDVVPWLRATTYISTDTRSYGRDAVDWSENKVMGGHAGTSGLSEAKSREEQIEAIERTFEAAASGNLVHPDNPNLTPVEVTPILPHKPLWGQTFLHGAFDNNPTASVRWLERQPAAVRRAHFAQALLTQRHGGTESEFTLFLPQQETFEKRERVRAGEAPDVAVGDKLSFEKARDYVIDIKPLSDAGEDVFALGTADGVTLYKDFTARAKITRRRERARGGARRGRETLVVTHRLATEDELAAERDKCQQVFYAEMERVDEAGAAEDGDAAADADGAGAADGDAEDAGGGTPPPGESQAWESQGAADGEEEES